MAVTPERAPTGPPERDSTTRIDIVPTPLSEARELLLALHLLTDRADLKASILIAAFTAGLIGEGSLFPLAVEWAQSGGSVRWIVVGLLGGSFLLLVTAMVFGGLSVYPRLGREYQVPSGAFGAGDLVYFGRLRLIPPEAIASALKEELEQDTFVRHYAEQLHQNARAAWAKYVLIQRALRALGLAAALAVAAALSWGLLLAFD